MKCNDISCRAEFDPEQSEGSMRRTPMNNEFKIALSLGGGGVRSLAHIGVLRVIEKEGIPIDYLCGTSMGAVLGAHYALYKNVDELEKVALKIVNEKQIRDLEMLARKSEPEEKKALIEKLSLFVKDLFLWNLSAIKKSALETEKIEPYIKQVVGEHRFEDTKIPFACWLTDLSTGEEFIVDKGPMAHILAGSCAIPGIFTPVEFQNRLFIDGGIVSPVSANVGRKMGADFVIICDVDSGNPSSNFENGMNIMFQADYIRSQELTKLKNQTADFVIHPAVKSISWASFSMAKECIKKGEEKAQALVDDLKSQIRSKRRRHALGQFFPFLKK